jgi:hypothetical protein
MAAEERTMAQQPGERNPAQGGADRHLVGEWFWRFLAVVMVATVGWVIWIAYQISPPAVFTPAAFQAAAQARSSHPPGSPTQGTIKAKPAVAQPAVAPQGAGALAAGAAAPASTQAPASPAPSAAKASEPSKAPPVNLEKLRLFESLETPIAAKAEGTPRK